MGGNLGFESEPGTGSRFWFRIPCRPVSDGVASEASGSTENERAASGSEVSEPATIQGTDEAAELPTASSALSEQVSEANAPRVLIVEDNLINQMITSELVSNAGCVFEVADNGQIAVDLISKQPFDIVLMDCQMPVMNGFEATAEIRRLQSAGELPHLSSTEIPVLAVTANAFESDRHDCLNAGMNAHLTKPIDRDTLLAAMEERLGITLGSRVPE